MGLFFFGWGVLICLPDVSILKSILRVAPAAGTKMNLFLNPVFIVLTPPLNITLWFNTCLLNNKLKLKVPFGELKYTSGCP